MSEDHSKPSSGEPEPQGQGPDTPPAESRKLERVGGRLLVSTPFFSVRNERFRHPDGGTTQRDLVMHPGSVGIVAHDGSNVL